MENLLVSFSGIWKFAQGSTNYTIFEILLTDDNDDTDVLRMLHYHYFSGFLLQPVELT